MPAGWAAAAAAVVGGVMQADASKKASQQAADASSNSLALQKEMFDTQNKQQAPYRQTGYNALGLINQGFGTTPTGFDAAGNPKGPNGAKGITDWAGSVGYDLPQGRDWMPSEIANLQPGYDAYLAGVPGANQNAAQTGANAPGSIGTGYFNHQFDANDLNANLAPNWKFALDQGIGATKNAGNLQTGLLSGNTLKGVADYTLNKSGDLYQQAYNNYTANQSNIFNRLSNVAGLGSAANTQSSGLAGTLGTSIGNTAANVGAAQAAGTVGQANALSGAANNALGWYQLSNLTKPATTGGGTGSTYDSGSNFDYLG